ncbi:Ribonuclease H-like domain containing protein [Rhypophila sp. PSN 637]
MSDFPTKTKAFARISIPKKSFLKQIRDAQAVGPLALDLPTNEYPLITGPENRKYKLRAHFYGKPRPSWIQQYGTLLLRLVPGNLDTQDATSSAGKHLVNRHRITKDGEVSPAANNTGKRQILIDELVATPTNKRVKLPPYMEQKDGFKDLLVNWMADSDIPFSVVENKRFRALLSLLNPVLVNELLPKSHNTARSWLNTIYTREFNALKQDLLATPNPIHISFDGWSSPGTATFLPVVVHYFNTASIFHTTLIALPRIKGTHNGENLAKGVIEVIKRFGFQSKLGFFQADNAENNDTCITELLKHFNPYLSTTQIDILQSCKRVHCVGHILNLIARAFLDGENKEIIKKLAKGKLQYLVHFARRMPQRKDAFNDFTHGKLLQEEEAEFGAILIDPTIRNLQLKADNDTRWHSAVLTEVKAILAPFKFITKKFEGRKPNLSDVVTHIFSLHRDLKHLHREYTATFERSGGFGSSIFPPNNERPTGRLPAFLVPIAQERPQRIRRVPARFTDYEVDLSGIGRGRTVVAAGPQGPHIELGTPLHDDLEVTSYSSLQSSIKYAIDKLEKYMEILDETPAYWAAHVLHPGRRMKWPPDDVDGFGDDFYHNPVTNDVVDEVGEYLRGPVLPVDDPVQWWKAKALDFPRLSKIAL